MQSSPGASYGLPLQTDTKVLHEFDAGINLFEMVFFARIDVVFDYLPARRAAGTDPIESLRQESVGRALFST